MPYKAVVFDLDGTLVESHIDYEKMGQQIKELLDRMGMKTHIEDRRIGTRDHSGDPGIAGDTPSDLRSDDAGIFKFTWLAGATFESLQRQQHRNL